MLRKTAIFLFLSLALVVGGCSKSAPTTAAEGDQSSSLPSPAETTESDASAGGASTPSFGLDGLPIVYFGFNDYSLTSEDREKLKAVSDQLKKSSSKITVEGHCDERGSSEYNLALGERRAQSVKSYLQKLGVSSTNLATISYGKERPADSGHGESAWAKNRRGELVTNR